MNDQLVTKSARPSVSELAVKLLSGPDKFTDLLIESDQPAMMRHSVGTWTEVLDEHGKEIVFTLPDLHSFLNGVFTQDESASGERSVKWKSELYARHSLHPATNLSFFIDEARTTMVSHRVRCTVQMQTMGEAIGLVMRPLRSIPESVESLGLPIQASKMLQANSSGMIVVTGPTGSGKSTTLAAMVNEINASRRANILTLEDPVEFQHERKKSIINQRELGVDVKSYEAGVQDALRFVPDVILIGEIRDAATMRAALRAAESGHLVLTTTHAPTTVAAIRKMLAYLDNSVADSQALAACLVGIIAQALIRDQKKAGENHLAYEVLNCRDLPVIEAVSAAASDGSGRKLTELENRVRGKELSSNATIPMMASLRKLVEGAKVDGIQAASVAVHSEDKQELLRMAQQASNTKPSKPNENWAESTGVFRVGGVMAGKGQ